MMRITVRDAMRARLKELRKKLSELRQREEALRSALLDGKITDLRLREVTWERVHELEDEQNRIMDEIDELWIALGMPSDLEGGDEDEEGSGSDDLSQ